MHVFTAWIEWIDARKEQRYGYWFNPEEWHQTPYLFWWRWLIGHKHRRVRYFYASREVEYATDRQRAQQALAEQFDLDLRSTVASEERAKRARARINGKRAKI